MAIHWFPGHMATAKRDIRNAMPDVDLLLEVLDARIPFTSQNPMVDALGRDKPRIKVLNKADLADPAITDAWLAHLATVPGVRACAIQANQPGRARALLDAATADVRRSLLPVDRSPSRRVQVMVLGVPNVGKSTLINALAGRTIAKTGDKPAVTKGTQRVDDVGDFVLLDTPGFLWPRLSPAACGYRLAITGAIAETAFDYEDLALFAGRFLLAAYPAGLRSRYGLASLPDDPAALLDAIAARRGCLGRGGVVDRPKVATLLIREFRQGLLGRISLETPADAPAEAPSE
jgi:ribosome biogenesis GTPase A